MFPASRNTWPCRKIFVVVTPGLGVGWVRTVFLASGGEREETAKHPTMRREASSHPSEEGSCSNSSTVTGTEAEKPCFSLSEPFIQVCTILPNGLGLEKGCVLHHQGHLVYLTHTRYVTGWLTFHLSCKSVHMHNTKCLLDIRR